ncbi:MAG: histidine phosphotransferase family protein [Rickettsiales bacterium]|nr:histidine phosphotransferase family protein [Rickettsiales bacterium]
MFSEVKLAEQLCTRLCHDLTGPISAVNNGAEFLSEEGFDMESEAMDLILNSATEAVRRLQFYRQAYGRINDNGEASLDEKRQVVEEFFSTTRIKVDWPDEYTDGAGVSVSHKMARLVMNVLIIASGILIRGGTIALHIQENDNKRSISLNASGPTVKLDEDILAVLRREKQITDLSPKTAQLALTLTIADEIDAKMNFDVTEEHANITIEQVLVTEEAPIPSFA